MNKDEMESVGAPMIRLNFSEWEFAPQFEYLKNAPKGECETSDTLSPDAVTLERLDSPPQSKARFLHTSLASVDEFTKHLRENELLFVLVFEKQPSDDVLKLLSHGETDERVLLLDVAEDRGFLKNTPITLGIPLIGLGAWSKGILIGVEEKESAMASLILKVRSLARPAS